MTTKQINRTQAQIIADLALARSASQTAFATIAVSGQSNVVADSAADTLTLVAGENIAITTNATTDAVTVSFAGGNGLMTIGEATTLGGDMSCYFVEATTLG